MPYEWARRVAMKNQCQWRDGMASGISYARTSMKTRPTIGNIEGTDGKIHTSEEGKSNALNRYFSSVFTQEDPNTAPIFHIDKSDDVSLSCINITPSIVLEKIGFSSDW